MKPVRSRRFRRVTLRVPADEARELEAILKAGKRVEDVGEDDVIMAYAVEFGPDALGLYCQADIKVCNAATESGGPWVDSVLYDEHGQETLCEPGESLLGEHVFYVPDQDGADVEHVVSVVAQS